MMNAETRLAGHSELVVEVSVSVTVAEQFMVSKELFNE